MKKQFFFFLTLILFSCKSGETTLPIPKNLIPEEKFTMILEELMVIEHQVQTDYPQIEDFRTVIKKAGDNLFLKYGVKKASFDKSFEYYASDLPKMKMIYTNILEKMSKNLTKLEANKID